MKTSKARRERLLNEFERSGLPGLKFAELAGIKYQTFATWAQKRRRQRGGYVAGEITAARKPVRCKRHAKSLLDGTTTAADS